jgi:hypothetical protein
MLHILIFFSTQRLKTHDLTKKINLIVLSTTQACSAQATFSFIHTTGFFYSAMHIIFHLCIPKEDLAKPHI